MSDSITLRVLEAYKYLYDNHIVKNQADFCRAIDLNYFSFSQVKRGTRNFPEGHLKKLTDIYYINRVFLTQGKLPMFINQPINIKRIKVSSFEVSHGRNKVTVTYIINGVKQSTEFIKK
jgi:hypothetical protein